MLEVWANSLAFAKMQLWLAVSGAVLVADPHGRLKC